MNLSEKEEKFLLKFEKNVQRSFIAYLSVVISLLTAIALLVIEIVFDRKELFLGVLILVAMGINIFSLTRYHKKLHTILNKMKQYIKEMEAGEN